jgi:hypothetical protein
MPNRTLSLLDADPDLAGGLTGERHAAAKRELICEVFECGRGVLSPSTRASITPRARWGCWWSTAC